jgi:transketolase
LGEQIGEIVEATLYFVPKDEFDRIRALNDASAIDRTRLFADMCRLNTLYMIARAGSGHIGSSFSSLDIVSWLYLNELKNDDLYFSSKGHDAPGLYAVLIGLGRLPFNKLHGLRRMGGLPGHPDVSVPGMVINSGSLGMGISKAKGMVRADRLKGHKRRFYVMTGDGELQEGQIWESLISAQNARMGEITVIVDHNKLQSDFPVSQTSDLGDLKAKFASFGWHVERCDGHNLDAFSATLKTCAAHPGRPQVIIADTIKGRGVSFMEHTALDSDMDMYRFHSGAPDAESYARGAQELVDHVNGALSRIGATRLSLETAEPPVKENGGTTQRLIPAYTAALIAHAAKDERIVALDADLVLDTGLIPFKERFPNRFVECGIAEMDMVSQAGGMALQGLIPICHSFGCFLSTRPNEQIYNNATERTKVIYVGSLAGLIPAAPGHSHQSLRDISALTSVPGLDIVEPCCPEEVPLLLDYLLRTPGRSGYLRLISVPWTVPFSYPGGDLQPGRGIVLREGKDAALVTYGLITTAEAYLAAEQLAQEGIETKVVECPFLNKVDSAWFAAALEGVALLCTVDNHYTKGGFGDHLLSALACEGASLPEHVVQLGINRLPACGQPLEVLRHHGLDAASIKDRLRHRLNRVTTIPAEVKRW